MTPSTCNFRYTYASKVKSAKSIALIALALLCAFVAGYVAHGQITNTVSLAWTNPPNTGWPVYYELEETDSLRFPNWHVIASEIPFWIDNHVVSGLVRKYYAWQLCSVVTTNPSIKSDYSNIATSAEVWTSVTDPLLVKQSLNLWWQGPPGWQTNGGIFNIRTCNVGSVVSNYLTWPVAARVTNILNIKFYNVNPTQFYAISFTNAITGTESFQGLNPVVAQYNWQGVTN